MTVILVIWVEAVWTEVPIVMVALNGVLLELEVDLVHSDQILMAMVGEYLVQLLPQR